MLPPRAMILRGKDAPSNASGPLSTSTPLTTRDPDSLRKAHRALFDVQHRLNLRRLPFLNGKVGFEDPHGPCTETTSYLHVRQRMARLGTEGVCLDQQIAVYHLVVMHAPKSNSKAAQMLVARKKFFARPEVRSVRVTDEARKDWEKEREEWGKLSGSVPGKQEKLARISDEIWGTGTSDTFTRWARGWGRDWPLRLGMFSYTTEIVSENYDPDAPGAPKYHVVFVALAKAGGSDGARGVILWDNNHRKHCEEEGIEQGKGAAVEKLVEEPMRKLLLSVLKVGAVEWVLVAGSGKDKMCLVETRSKIEEAMDIGRGGGIWYQHRVMPGWGGR